MENEHSALILTPEYFELILKEIHGRFLKRHDLSVLPKNYQLYGYGSYDPNKPSIRKDLEEISQEFVNGKYLYDKVRHLQLGRPIIRLSNFYATLILAYLDYGSIEDFIEEMNVGSAEREQQLELLNQNKSNESAYFLTYYFGEFQSIIKGFTIISQNWKRIHHTFFYRNKDGTITEMYSQGSITKGRDTLHTKCKTIIDNKVYDGDSEIFYVGQVELSELHFIQGNYISFNLHTNPVAGRVILERCRSEEDMRTQAAESTIPPYIAQEIRNNILVSPNSIANSYLELSDKSPYASIYAKIPGIYKIALTSDESEYVPLEFEVKASDYKLISLNPDIYFEENHIELLNKGTILYLRFSLSGITDIYSIDIYVKSVVLREDSSSSQNGVFSGVDNENQLVSGSARVSVNR
ncbi:hypothetical protein [Ekhidna sp.]|uniref:hypothetical protein n=1 Tax=Ekhidna sp. TaxID=2608089 RepID=UPI003296DAA7